MKTRSILFTSFTFLAIGAGLISTIGCQNQTTDHEGISTNSNAPALRAPSLDERSADFDQMVTLFKSYYGPYSYKENRLGYSIDTLAATLKAQALAAKSDEEFAGVIMQFGATLKDGHVQIRAENSTSGISRYQIPILLTPVEKHALVGDISAELAQSTGISVGDEILQIDGVDTLAYLPKIAKYRQFATDLSNEHLIVFALSRPSYMTDLTPKSSFVRLKVKTARGETLVQDVPWLVSKYNEGLDKIVKPASHLDMSVPFAQDYNSVAPSHIGDMGAVDPFFVTSATSEAFGFVKVYPSDSARKAFGLKPEEKPPIYAALYKHQGKTVLLVRQATYAPSDFSNSVYMRAYSALLAEYQKLADVLVLDQTHNPGGSYCAGFYDLFANEGDVQSVQKMRADRKWVNDLKVNWIADSNGSDSIWDLHTVESWGLIVEKAYDEGALLSEPIPLFTGSFFSNPRSQVWNKPMLVLIDELAGSCGDMFPMLVKANGRAKLFGRNTMGLGGNVEEIGALNNTRIHISLTRGLFYPYNPNREPLAEEYIENNGVQPDYPYEHTVSDFRTGFVTYVKAFSDKAVEQITAP